MAQFHFVEDYEKHVANLKATHSLDDAMALAVGGSYHEIGKIESDILRYAGLKNGEAIFDLGCGSGRLASALGKSIDGIDYFGVDVVQDLLDYAAMKSPRNFTFKLHRELSIPLDDASVDVACAFSVFTHLLPQETFIYLDEMRRILKPGGRIVFSFLEFHAPYHWNIFENTVSQQRHNTTPHLNMFIERNVISVWADKLDLKIREFLDGNQSVSIAPLGQSISILEKNNI
ncbi:class I SAM-dependent methyltransferase [Burkholderia multivorans]|uniref:class I SAM-dependent methyltransferase n=1 Tax=Burkholderia multivorans TaxID=87883 RepID=UPI001C253684|nr:class I SAM-dependent methyltransferase [Burkholderia multivorans]MBU9592768.1 class I SAM-dependent methyltransferase [Burkholderia multivorans]